MVAGPELTMAGLSVLDGSSTGVCCRESTTGGASGEWPMFEFADDVTTVGALLHEVVKST